jgi:hypothetical protein
MNTKHQFDSRERVGGNITVLLYGKGSLKVSGFYYIKDHDKLQQSCQLPTGNV